MDMSFDTKALGPLFELSPAAVIAVENGVVLFVNPAAAELTGLHAGDNAASALPPGILDDPAERFSAACVIGGASADVTVVRQDSVTLIHAMRREPPPAFPAMDRILAELGVGLASTRFAADAIAASETVDKDGKSFSTLRRSLFRLRRLHSHMTLADCIMRGALPCRTRLADLLPVCGDICDSVDQTVRPLGYSVSFHAPDKGCFSMIDEGLIETMLLNLLTNSLLHTESGREISVTLSVIGERCVIAVSDAGSGMDAAKLSGALGGAAPAAFTDISAGSGLGLYVARGIAEAHGGTIILESREGIGTTVRVSLPRVRADGLTILHQPGDMRHVSGMDPILTELSVFLGREYFTSNMLD